MPKKVNQKPQSTRMVEGPTALELAQHEARDATAYLATAHATLDAAKAALQAAEDAAMSSDDPALSQTWLDARNARDVAGLGVARAVKRSERAAEALDLAEESALLDELENVRRAADPATFVRLVRPVVEALVRYQAELRTMRAEREAQRIREGSLLDAIQAKRLRRDKSAMRMPSRVSPYFDRDFAAWVALLDLPPGADIAQAYQGAAGQIADHSGPVAYDCAQISGSVNPSVIAMARAGKDLYAWFLDALAYGLSEATKRHLP